MIYTFYSYKGGVGRSMALANVAETLYQNGLRVLMIDFDLEAPGLGRFFLNSEHQDRDLLNRLGLIDLLNSYIDSLHLYHMGVGRHDSEDEQEILPFKFEPIQSFITPLYGKNSLGGELSIITSGKRSEDSFNKYAESVREFNWKDFYKEKEGTIFFDWLVQEVTKKDVSDVVLIDSRTGLTEMGGACTHHLADVVVLLVTPNEQDFYDTLKIARSLKNPKLQKVRGRTLNLVFVPSRVDNAESEKQTNFQKLFESHVGINQENFTSNSLAFEDRAFLDLKLPYLPYYSYERELAVRKSSHGPSSDLSKAYKRLSVTLSQLAPKTHRFQKVFSRHLDLLYANQYEHERAINRQHWGDAPEVSNLFGRTLELGKLNNWIVKEHCRIVAILGMGGSGKTSLTTKLGKGGIGKTDLSIKLARGIQYHFEYVVWHSLLSAPAIVDVLSDINRTLSDHTLIKQSGTTKEQLLLFLKYITEYRCLIIFDNFESVLCSGERVGQYKAGYEGYGDLLDKVGQMTHQSCVIFTSREKPSNIDSLETNSAQVRSLSLQGLDEKSGRKLFDSIGKFEGSTSEWERVIEVYNGNPLALKLAAKHILEVFDGNIGSFLKSGKQVFSNLRELLDGHFNRLTQAEKEIMYWLAINRKPVPIIELREDILSSVVSDKLTDVLQSLQMKLPVEKRRITTIVSQALETLEGTDVIAFSLQPVLIEYVVERIVNDVVRELKAETLSIFNNIALLKATTSEAIRTSQRRLILEPICKKMGEEAVDLNQLLGKLLNHLRGGTTSNNGYAVGNIINLLSHQGKDLSKYNFSNSTIRQAYLQGIQLQGTDFSYSKISKSIFTNTLSSVLSVTLSPDGNTVVTGDSKGRIRLWNTLDGQQLLDFQGHTNWVWSVSFSPDGKKLASASDDKTVRIWEVKTGRCLNILKEHTDWVRAVAFSPDGSLLASGSDDTTIRVWNVEKGEELSILTGHSMRIWSLAFSPDNHVLISGSDDRTLRIWDVQKQQCLKRISAHADRVQAVTFSHCGDKFASGSADSTIKLWDFKQVVSNQETENLKPLKELNLQESRVWNVAFSPDDVNIAIASDNKEVRLYNTETLQTFRTFWGHESRVWSVAFSPDGLKLATGSDDKTVKIWDIGTSESLQTLQGKTDRVWSVAFSPDGRFLANGSEDQNVRLWDLRAGRKSQYTCISKFQEDTNWVWSVAFDKEGTMLATGSDDQVVKIWDWKARRCIRKLKGHSNWVLSVSFSPDGKTLASASEDKTIRLWDVETETCFLTLNGHSDRVRSVVFSPDNDFVVSGSDDKTIIVWQLQSGKQVTALTAHQDRVRSVAFTPNGKFLASASDDKSIKIWDAETHELIKTLAGETGHTDRVVSIDFSPDSKILATGSDDTTVKIWDIRTGKCLTTLREHSRWVRSVAFSPNGKLLASSSQDETIIIWNIETFSVEKILKAEGPYEKMNITGVTGLTEAQKDTLKALGAVDSKVFDTVGELSNKR
ncbi:MAG: hypothetical protein AAGN15_02580 [Cyanobacteria bacterium J06581_3]